jgi:glucokinase
MFFRSAKAIATGLSCHSIILAANSQVNDDKFIRNASKALKEEFYDFIRPDWLKDIHVYGQIKLTNFNILGTTFKATTLIQ